MNSRVDAVNRVVLTVLGLLLLAAGGLGIAAGAGAFSGAHNRQLLSDQLRRFIATTPWFWWATAGAALLIAVLALLWLLAQLRSDRASQLDLTTNPTDGLITVRAGALTTAVSDEAQTVRGVTRATASLRQRPRRYLALTVDLADYADIADVRDSLEGSVATHARQALDDPRLPIDITLRPGRNRGTGRGLR